ncbi:MAG TPA: hypothetical protein ENG78_01840 [Acidiferrobacteraceae bacterium]|nr:hypothetical protein [Acidiferrobacteraceae bacterium]HEX19552.1 hypothetical protein [Acidiferrobacteraceae bacterium]
MAERRFAHFLNLPPGSRVLYTMTLVVLGLGYLFAMIYIFEVHAGRDGKPGLSINDLVIAYSGSQKDTRLEAAIKGPMSGMLHKEDSAKIITWVRDGSKREDFKTKVAPILQEHCLSCHDGSNPHIPDLKGYNNVMKTVQLDTGMNISTLVRVSHIHLFGMTFIFFVISLIFVHAYVRPPWLKSAIIVTPFVAIILDISAWYLTKVYTPFAWMVMIGGGFMGLAFAIQWIVSIYQMWFYKLPPEITEKGGELPRND